MDCIGIIRNCEIEASAAPAELLADFFRERGVRIVCAGTGEELDPGCGCAVVIGGDGTLLHAAKAVLDRQIPLLGVNVGALGYLAEVEVGGLLPAMEKLLEGRYTIEKRMMLEGSVVRNGRTVFGDTALNDVCIKGRSLLRSYRFLNYVNGEYLNALSADGVIISTATGSTGYNLSVGGPIVSPEAETILLTPLAPHSLVASRTIIFSGTDCIRVEVGEGRSGFVPEAACVRFDGAEELVLSTGDSVRIRRSRQYTRLIKINHVSFLEVLRKKMSES